ncbi:TPA: MFS transporter, partial [Pseudomonas aeruginosa]|nr:MFS transporter [Pseudomonas aeruginosa]
GALLHQLDNRAPYALVGLLLALAAFWPSQPTRPVETRSEAP